MIQLFITFHEDSTKMSHACVVAYTQLGAVREVAPSGYFKLLGPTDTFIAVLLNGGIFDGFPKSSWK